MILFYLLLATRFSLGSSFSCSFQSRLASNDWSSATKWDSLLTAAYPNQKNLECCSFTFVTLLIRLDWDNSRNVAKTAKLENRKRPYPFRTTLRNPKLLPSCELTIEKIILRDPWKANIFTRNSLLQRDDLPGGLSLEDLPLFPHLPLDHPLEKRGIGTMHHGHGFACCG